MGIAVAGLFVLHCLRNAFADESVLPTDLRRRIVELHETVMGEAEHLHRDWGEEERRRQELAERVADVAGLSGRLGTNAFSIDNLRSR